MQEDHSDCSRLAQHGSHVKPDLCMPAQAADSALQSDSPHESVEPKSPCLALRASAIMEQDSSEPDQSMKLCGPFLQNGVQVIRWTSGHHL